MSYDYIDLNFRKSRIPYFKLSHKLDQKAKLKKKLDQFNTYLKTFGLSFNKIEIVSIESEKDKKIKDCKKDYKFDIVEKPTGTSNEAAIFQTARDLSLMSERSYLSFRDIVKPIVKLPAISKCNEYKKKVNSFWPLRNNELGSYIKDPSSKIKFVCQKYLADKKRLNSGFQVKDNIFKILLCGDCINVTRTNLSVLNFAFSLLNSGDLSRKGFYALGKFLFPHLRYYYKFKVLFFKLLGLFNLDKDDYENIKIALKELLNKLQEIREIVLNDTKYRILFLFGGDLKWISAAYGINAANSSYPCPWCTWKVKNKTMEENIDETYSIYGRSHEHAQVCLKNNNTIDGRQGYKDVSLFPFIEFHNVVVDILHMTLRISDKLFEMLLTRLRLLENKKTRDLTEIFKNFIETQCNISSPFFVTEPEMKMRSLNQNERLKIFDKLLEIDDDDSDNDLSDDDDDAVEKERKRKNRQSREVKRKLSFCKPLVSLFPSQYQDDSILNSINDLCLKYRKILEIIKSQNARNLVGNLKKRLKKWLNIFISIEKKITPYIHIFCFHIPEFIEVHEDLNLFSMQGLEHLNCFSKLNYFRQTNRKKDKFASTLLEKMNRIDFYHINGKLELNDEDIIEDVIEDEDNKYSDMFDFLKDS